MNKILPPQSIRLQHFLYETESWTRLLLFYKEEMVHFKNRLVEVMAESEDDANVLVAEKYLEEYLALDKVFLYLSEEVLKQNKLLQKDLFENEVLLKEVTKNQVNLRREIKNAEVMFTKIKKKCVHYLNEQFGE